MSEKSSIPTHQLSPETLKCIDLHSAREAALNYPNYQMLINNLLNFQETKLQNNDFVKARLIFKWLTYKKLETITFNEKLENVYKSREYNLKKFIINNESYASIFAMMCNSVGINTIVVEGWAKGGNHLPGNYLSKHKFNHSWNIITLSGRSYIIDVRWASRFVHCHKGSIASIKSDFSLNTNGSHSSFDDFRAVNHGDDFYYTAEPEKIIYSHYPANPIYQLLDEPKTFDWFIKSPNIKSYFFKSEMGLCKYSKMAIIICDSKTGTCLFSFTHRPKGSFHYTIIPFDSENNRSTLGGYILFEQVESHVFVHFRAKDCRKYLFTLFSRFNDISMIKIDVDGGVLSTIDCNRKELSNYSSLNLINNRSNNSDGLQDQVSTFRAVSEHVIDGSFLQRCKFPPPFPECISNIWGVQPEDMDKFKLTCLQKQSTGFIGKEGFVIYPFLRTSCKNDRKLCIHARVIYSSGDKKQTFDNCYLFYEYKNSFIVVVKPPVLNVDKCDFRDLNLQAVEYGVEFYTKFNKYLDTQSDETEYTKCDEPEYTSICQYLIVMFSSIEGNNVDQLVCSSREYTSMNHGLFLDGKGALDALESKLDVKLNINMQQIEKYWARKKFNEIQGIIEERNGTGLENSVTNLSIESTSVDSTTLSNINSEEKKLFATSTNSGDISLQLNDTLHLSSPTLLPKDLNPLYMKSGDDETKKDSDLFLHLPLPDMEYVPHSQDKYIHFIEKEAPDNFQALETKTASVSTIKIEKSLSTKKPFRDSDVFSHVDKHATAVISMQHKSFKDLIWHLIYARNIENELERARVIFLWLCCINLSKLDFNNQNVSSPEYVLMSLKQDKVKYSNVFALLCSYAGMQCCVVNGFAKGFDYSPGMKFNGDFCQHSWNAVLVDNTWRLIDCHWAARRFIGKDFSSDNLHYQLDDFYFCPDPHHMIFTHFPNEPKWQLLKRSINLPEFENLVTLKSNFFKNNMSTISHNKAIIESCGQLMITFNTGNKETDFTTTLSRLYPEVVKDVVIMTDCVSFEKNTDNSKVSFFIRTPLSFTKINYKLTIYVNQMSQTKIIPGKFSVACEYEIVCRPRKNGDKIIHPFPPMSTECWGETAANTTFGLIPSVVGNMFHVTQTECELKFQYVNKNLNLLAHVRSRTYQQEDLKQCVLGRSVVGRAGEKLGLCTCAFGIRFPSDGEYCVEVRCSDNTMGDSNSFILAYQYLLLVESGYEKIRKNVTNEIFSPFDVVRPIWPPLHDWFLGKQRHVLATHLKPINILDSYIKIVENSCTLCFSLSDDLDVVVNLHYFENSKTQNSNGGKGKIMPSYSQIDMKPYSFSEFGDKTVDISLRFPKFGFYKCCLYAKFWRDNTDNYPNVYNFLIEYEPNYHDPKFVDNGDFAQDDLLNTLKLPPIAVYPKAYTIWRKNGGKLYCPQSGTLSLNKNIKFKIRVSNALQVILNYGENVRSHFHYINKEDLWETWEKFNNIDWKGKVQILAIYDMNSSKIDVLLEYLIE